jgi:homoserine kinase
LFSNPKGIFINITIPITYQTPITNTLRILIANEIYTLTLTKPQITDLGTILEGHPDNIAASVYGGLTVSLMTRELPSFDDAGLRGLIGGLVKTCKVEVNRDVNFTAVIPDFELGREIIRETTNTELVEVFVASIKNLNRILIPHYILPSTNI